MIYTYLDVVSIPLAGRGAVDGGLCGFIVDGADADMVRRFRWYLNRGYVKALIDGHTVSVQRLLMGATPGERLFRDVRTGGRVRVSATKQKAPRRGRLLVVDHINGDRLDNRRCNLRIATTRENNRNRKSERCGYLGVRERPGRGWFACIYPGRGIRYSPLYATEAEAACGRDALTRHYYGEFGRLNFPGEIGNPPTMTGSSVHPCD